MKLTVFAILLLTFDLTFAQANNDSFEQMMTKCDNFVNNYKPTYIFGRDTFVVSRFTIPPNEINKFLFDCIKNKDFRPLKYSCVIVIKQNTEYSKVNKEDQILDDTSYVNNGFLELLRTKMNVPLDNSGGYMTLWFSGEIYKWINDNKNKIDDFEYIDNYLKKNK